MSDEASSLNDVNDMTLDDPLMEQYGLQACWKSTYSLMTFASPGNTEIEESSRDTKRYPICLYEVNWNKEMHSPIGRKLVNESRSLFIAVQKLCSSEGGISAMKPQLLKISRNYRSILRSCFLELQHNFEASEETDEEMDKQIKLFSMMELIWSLCEILFVENLPGGVVLLQLVDWCNWHFPVADVYVQSVTSSVNNVQPVQQQPHYWKAIHCLALQGRISDVRNMLKLHPSYQTKIYDAFSSIDELLRKMPLFSYHQGQSMNEFEMKWRHWHDECAKRLRGGDFDTVPELKILGRILCGDEEIFFELSDLCGSWYQMLVSFLLFKHPTISAYDLHYHCKIFIEICGGFSEFTPLDKMLLAAFKLDVSQVIRECCKNLSSWWLPAHLADLLHYSGMMPSNPSDGGIDLREYLIVEYASSLSSLGSFWSVVVDYLAHCGSQSQHFLSLFIQRIPLTSEKKASKVLRLCEQHGLAAEARSICRQMTMKAMQFNRLGTALSWCIKANDSSFAMIIADKMLKEYARTGKFSNIDLIDYLGPSVLVSERLTFLGKYRDFHKLYANEQFKQAGQLLLHLIVSKKSPLDFWPSLLMDCLPLLEKDDLIYGVEETTSLLACLNALDQRDKAFDALTETEKQNQEKKMKHLRLALTNNLAKAIVS